MKKPVYLSEFHYQQSDCPACGHRLDGLTLVGLEKPTRDDWTPSKDCFSICVYCTAILRFQTKTQLRTADSQEIIDLLSNAPEVFSLLQSLVAAAIQFRRERQRERN